MTPKDLVALADSLDAEGLALARSGDTHGAAVKFTEANNLRRTAAAMGGLPARVTSGRTRPVVTDARLQRSESAVGGDDPLAKAARAAGMTVRQLAGRVRVEMANREGFRGCSHVTLMRARRKKQGIWRPVAALIERLTGFPATLASWPGGIRD